MGVARFGLGLAAGLICTGIAQTTSIASEGMDTTGKHWIDERLPGSGFGHDRMRILNSVDGVCFRFVLHLAPGALGSAAGTTGSLCLRASGNSANEK